MIENPRPDLLGAPKWLPTREEIALDAQNEYLREVRYMAQMYYQLLDEIDQNEELQARELLEQFDLGFEEGYAHGLDQLHHETGEWPSS